MKYYMAPMEGLTGYIYRNAYQKYFHDIDRYFTPFITNKKLDFKVKKDIDPEHNQGMEVVPQILTNQPDDFISIVKQLKQYGYDEVNLNLGCPSGTVVAKNRGAGFLAVPDQLDSFLDKIFKSYKVIQTRYDVVSFFKFIFGRKPTLPISYPNKFVIGILIDFWSNI